MTPVIVDTRTALLVVAFILGLQSCSPGSLAHALSTNVGRNFIFAYADNYLPNSDPTVIVTNMSPLEHEVVTVTILTPVHGILVTMRLQGFLSSEQVTIPREVVPVGPDFVMVAILVEADDDITVHAVNDVHDRSMDGFAVLPVSSLGTEYYVASYTASLRSQIVIAATEPDTSILVYPSEAVIYKAREVRQGSTIRIAGQTNDAFLLEGRGDLTGTRIVSDKPVAVLTGNRCAFIPVGVISCDHLVEMLSPFNQWGREFVIVPFLGRGTGIIYRVIAGRSGTEITVKSETTTLQTGQYREYEVAVGQTDFVQSSKPVQVVQYTKGFRADNVNGDPAMTIVPPMEQSISTVLLPTYNTTKDFKVMQNYVNVYARCTDMHYFNITFDGDLIREMVPRDRILRAGRSDYCAVGLHLSPGIHTLSAGPSHRKQRQGEESFVAVAYGFAEMNSYAWPAGLATRGITCQYEGQDQRSYDYDCSKAIFIETTPCNDTFVATSEPCENVECVPNEYVIYISLGVALMAVILYKLLDFCVIQKTKTTKKQLPFGQIGLESEPPAVIVPVKTVTPVEPERNSSFLQPPTPSGEHSRRTSRQERADRMRARSRSPSMRSARD